MRRSAANKDNMHIHTADAERRPPISRILPTIPVRSAPVPAAAGVYPAGPLSRASLRRLVAAMVD